VRLHVQLQVGGQPALQVGADPILDVVIQSGVKVENFILRQWQWGKTT
jgi:hypothetical protein